MSTAEDFKNQGNNFFKEGKYEEAIQSYSKAIDLQPENTVFYSNRAGAYLNKGDFQMALNDSEKCLSLDKSFIKGYTRKAAALERMGQTKQALEVYQQGLQVDSKNAEIISNISWLEQQQQNNFQNLLNDPQVLEMMQKNPQLFQQLLSNPEIMKNPQAFKNMMNFFNQHQPQQQQPQQQQQQQQQPQSQQQPQQQQNNKQEKQQEKKTEETPKQNQQKNLTPFESIKKEADSLYMQKKFEQAIEKYQECISLEKENLIPYNNIAACYIELKQYEKSVEILQQSIKIYEVTPYEKRSFENYAKILERFGRVYFLLKDFDQSIQYYKNSLLENNVPKVRNALKEVEREKKAQEDLKYINPELSNQHREKGNEFFKEGKFGEAILQYEEAVKRDPKDIRNYTNLSSCFIKMMNFNEAKRYAEKALEIDPKNVKAMQKQAQCFSMSKEYHKAIEVFEQILKIDPQNSEAQKGLQQTNMKIAQENRNLSDEERQKKAMSDPQIQAIIQDPMVQIALQQMQQNPQSAHQYFSDSTMGPKLQKLIQAGIIRTG